MAAPTTASSSEVYRALPTRQEPNWYKNSPYIDGTKCKGCGRETGNSICFSCMEKIVQGLKTSLEPKKVEILPEWGEVSL